jgi:hypothetical protein
MRGQNHGCSVLLSLALSLSLVACSDSKPGPDDGGDDGGSASLTEASKTCGSDAEFRLCAENALRDGVVTRELSVEEVEALTSRCLLDSARPVVTSSEDFEAARAIVRGICL